MKPRAAIIIQSADGSISWRGFDEVYSIAIDNPEQDLIGPAGSSPRFERATISVNGVPGPGGHMPPGWVFNAAALPTPSAPSPTPADMVLVLRALLLEAADHVSVGGSDPYEDRSDHDLARRLREAAGKPA